MGEDIVITWGLSAPPIWHELFRVSSVSNAPSPIFSEESKRLASALVLTLLNRLTIGFRLLGNQIKIGRPIASHSIDRPLQWMKKHDHFRGHAHTNILSYLFWLSNLSEKKGASPPFSGNALAAKSYIYLGCNHIIGMVKKKLNKLKVRSIPSS